MNPEIPRPKLEIIRAHDILDEIINNEEIKKIVNIPDESLSQMIAVKRTLCWILGHDEGRWFDENLKKIQDSLKDMGFELHSIQ